MNAQSTKEETMTTASVMHLIGQQRTIDCGSLTIDVTILDVKQSYGRTRYLVAPIAGHGSQWVETVRPARTKTEAKVQKDWTQIEA